MLNKSGFTIVEALLAALISAVIAAGLFFALKAGISSQSVGSSKADLQSEVRRAVDWIAKDVRSSVCWDIADAANNPSPTHIKFRQVQGWDIAGNNYSLSSDYIEYVFDATAKTITRSDTANPGSNWAFNNIIQPPFYTRDSLDNNKVVDLNSGKLLTSKRLIIVIAGESSVDSSTNLNYTLTSEIKIRNE